MILKIVSKKKRVIKEVNSYRIHQEKAKTATEQIIKTISQQNNYIKKKQKKEVVSSRGK